MKRERFLRSGAGAMSAIALAPLGERAAAADTLDVTLTGAPLRFAPAPGVAFSGLAYNGTIPGPVLRVRRGQRLRATYHNRTGDMSTIHWHGMILPNAMDGVPDITQAPIPNGGTFVYDYVPGPVGTRWYHSHAGMQFAYGLFGVIVVDDPSETPADREYVLVFHDVPDRRSLDAAMAGSSTAPMVDPFGSPELRAMSPTDRMGDEAGYVAHCVNGASYPKTAPLMVRVGERVRIRVLNANPTQTRYVRLAGHALEVTHSDGNALPRPVTVDALRIGVGERYDASFEVTKPGAWLLQGLSTDPLAYEQAVVVATPGSAGIAPMSSPSSLDGLRIFTYERASGVGGAFVPGRADVSMHFELGGGRWRSNRWTMNGRVWPNTEKIRVRRNDRVLVSFKNTTDMHHPMHLHGHTFAIVEMNGKALLAPLHKDVSLVDPNGGTMTWQFDATSPAGRWLLHCHNEIHMDDGMMTEVDYV